LPLFTQVPGKRKARSSTTAPYAGVPKEGLGLLMPKDVPYSTCRAPPPGLNLPLPHSRVRASISLPNAFEARPFFLPLSAPTRASCHRSLCRGPRRGLGSFLCRKDGPRGTCQVPLPALKLLAPILRVGPGYSAIQPLVEARLFFANITIRGRWPALAAASDAARGFRLLS
jgi:hypothetical protein